MNPSGPPLADADPTARLAALEQARAVAEAANQAKTRFLMGLSHEIRTPLNAIHGYAQLLERGAAIAPAEAGRIIRRSSEHLADLVEGLLDISRIESGVMKLNRETVALRALLEQVAAMFRIEAGNKGLDFVFELAANLPTWVMADERRLRQVLINLLSNALKYTETGSVTLAVRYRSMVAEFEIADTGIGIAPEDAERIFLPFDRGGGRAAGVAPGIGLGLALSRMLAQIMGGDIAVKSEAGDGSRFTLKLLLPQPTTAPPAAQARGLPIGYAGRRRTILAIDDDPGQLALWQELLRPIGFNLFVAGSGGAGLSLAELGRPDVVLLDVSMPGLNGWEVAQRLRTRFGRDISILMVSGNATELVGVASTGLHDGFVLKPVDQQTLFDTLGRQLGLIWAHEGRAERPAAVTLPDAARAHLAGLAQLARTGHVRGLTGALAALAQAVPAAGALVARLTSALDDYDLAGFQRLLAEQQPPEYVHFPILP